MKFKKISELSFELPKWLTWIEWNEDSIIESWNKISALCEDTWLMVTLIIEKEVIDSYECLSMVKNSKRCLSERWPLVCWVKFPEKTID